MTESTKTMTMAGVAAALLVLAIITRPKLPYAEPEGEVGQLLFTGWKDPAAAKSMEIATFDETTQAPRDFKVALVDGKWSIPSHGNYPANAEDKVVKAASDLINLKILGVVSDAPGSHATYGVVEPDPVKLKGPAVGVGKLVVVKDGSGKDLARLVIGKEDKSSGSESTSLRFVRRAGQDRVYRAAMPNDLFSTKFQDWIDPDLLGLKQHWDITKMQFRDYSLEVGGVARKSDVALEYNDQKASWAVKQLTDYKDGKPVEAKLGPDDEIDTAKLNDAKMNLSGLKISNVGRKPSKMAENLKKNKDILTDREALESMAEHDFYASNAGKSPDLFSAGDDLTVGMKDGVEYVIHFGKDFFTSREKNEAKGKTAAAKDGNEGNLTDHSRYVLVSARFNEDLLTKPALEPLPETKPPADNKPAETKPATKDSAPKPLEGKAPAAAAPGAKTPDAKKSDAKKVDAKKSTDANRQELILAMADAPAAAPASKSNDPKKPDEKQTNAAKPADKAATDKKPAEKKPDAKPDEAKKPEETKNAETEKKPVSGIKRADEEKARDELRKRIDADNKRKSDEYDAAVKRGKEHAKQLNDRFADWYYVIPEDDYKKIHLTRADIIKKKSPPEGTTGAGLGPGLTDPFQKAREEK